MAFTLPQYDSELTRRDVLRVGGLIGMGLSLSDVLNQRAFAADNRTFGKAKQVI
ncbi:MAG: hypothetical protein HON92_12965, partial [Planctomycetaceae bacterium]|nr:hypothetical protein [Planctomycetaceae bacterium]